MLQIEQVIGRLWYTQIEGQARQGAGELADLYARWTVRHQHGGMRRPQHFESTLMSIVKHDQVDLSGAANSIGPTTNRLAGMLIAYLPAGRASSIESQISG